MDDKSNANNKATGETKKDDFSKDLKIMLSEKNKIDLTTDGSDSNVKNTKKKSSSSLSASLPEVELSSASPQPSGIKDSRINCSNNSKLPGLGKVTKLKYQVKN